MLFLGGFLTRKAKEHFKCLKINPTGISALAECLHCPELKTAADEFIYQHFTDVYKLDEFLQLDVKQVTHLLHQDTLTVRAEDQVRKILATLLGM